jgi:hypothetical protein
MTFQSKYSPGPKRLAGESMSNERNIVELHLANEVMPNVATIFASTSKQNSSIAGTRDRERIFVACSRKSRISAASNGFRRPQLRATPPFLFMESAWDLPRLVYGASLNYAHWSKAAQFFGLVSQLLPAPWRQGSTAPLSEQGTRVCRVKV